MRFHSHRKHQAIPTLYIKSPKPSDDMLNIRNVMRQDFDYEGLGDVWVDYIVIEEEINHIVPLIRLCYNADTLLPYNPFGFEHPNFTYMRMRLRT